MADNRVQQLVKRCATLRMQREELLPEWRDIMDNFCPRTQPYLLNNAKDQSRKNRRNRKIINTHPVRAARTHQRGMTAGLASASRPWFRLKTPDRDLNKFKPVALWLHDTQQALEDMFARSNFYNAIGQCYWEQGLWGTLALGMFEDFEDDLRCISYPIGSYLIAQDANARVNTFYREYFKTADQIVQMFCFTDANGIPQKKPDLSLVSPEVKRAYENPGNKDAEFPLVHVIEPNYERNPFKVDAKNMAFRSCYFEPSQATQGKFLRESGFEENPVKVARREVSGEDAWGHGPGLEALGDARGLQERERQKAKKLDKHNDPALVGHPDLKNKRVSLLNGDVTYAGFTPNGGAPQLRPIHEVDGNVASLTDDIREIEARISRCFDEDLFLMLSMSDAKDVTAEAIAKKYEEKVVMLGPTLERQNDEVFDPAIERAFAIAARRGKLRPPPEELEEMPLKVEYVGLLQQAQRLVNASSIERTVGFVGSLAKAQADAGEAPDIFDKLDFDQAVDEHAEALGTMPTIIRSDDEVAQLREDRAQQQRLAQLAAAAKPVADAARAAKDLSQTPVGQGAALDKVLPQQ